MRIHFRKSVPPRGKFSEKNTALMQRVKSAIHSSVPGASVILYGSRARGDARADSDWDFMILTDGPRTPELEEICRNILYDIELDTDTVISSIIRSKEEWNSNRYKNIPLKIRVDKEGMRI
ncbi:MAG: nucleotidyltransferase domain-containing protein [Desulfobacterales bacterium]